MRVKVLDIESYELSMRTRQKKESFVGYYADFYPMSNQDTTDGWQSGTLYMLEGPLDHTKTNSGYYFENIKVEADVLDRLLGV